MKYKTIIGNTLVLEKLSENGKKEIYTNKNTICSCNLDIK